MAKISVSDGVNGVSGAVSTGAASANATNDRVQKTAAVAGTASGLAGAARDAKSAAIAGGANSAFSPPAYNFGRTNPNNVFTNSQSLRPKQLPFSKFTVAASVLNVGSVAYGLAKDYFGNKDKTLAQAFRDMPMSDWLALASVASAGIPPIAASLAAASAVYALGNNSNITVGHFIDSWEDLLNGDLKVTPEDLGNLFEDFSRWFYDWFPDDWNPWKNLNRNGKYHQYDPLTLDLDGDGIETIAAAGFAGSLFDHNRDGIRTATGWVAADDGLLVRDLNGNGKIDNGGELFGDNTLLKNGNAAAHGYAALADLDDNGDGKIDASDAAFADLRVWRDLNQDGESQSNELLTLQDLGIQSLNTAYKDSNKNLGNGNTLAQTGSYTKTDGTTADMGDLLLAHDGLHSRFTDKVELTAEQARAANLSGIGRLRDLREAAALSGDLANVLKAYSAAETKEAQLALLDALVHEWAETDREWGKKPLTLSSSWVRTANEGVALTPSQISKLKGNEMIFLSDEAQAAIDAARDRIAILDAFSGQDSSTLYYMSEEDALNIVKVTNDTYNSLATNIYQSLLLQTRLLPETFAKHPQKKLEHITFQLFEIFLII